MPPESARPPAPLVSVVVEGYNESLDLGSAEETLAALEQQDYPPSSIEVILVGAEAQRRAWEQSTVGHRFATTTFVAADGAHYYELKNSGADRARGEIVAFLDSDAVPHAGWLRALVDAIDAGADVSAGITTFRNEGGGDDRWALRTVAAAVSWGWLIGEPTGDGTERAARGFLSHNVGFRADVLRAHRYRTDLGRTCAGFFLERDLRQSGARIVFVPEQRVAHNFTLRWWLTRLHVRFGYEVFRLRRLGNDYPQRWVRRVPPLEPFLTLGLHVALDGPQWYRFSELLPLRRAQRLGLVPLLAAASVAARSAEAAGMLATLAMPERMRRFAERN